LKGNEKTTTTTDDETYVELVEINLQLNKEIAILKILRTVTALVAFLVGIGLGLFFASAADAEVFDAGPEARQVEVVGVVDISSLATASRIDALSKVSKEPITIIINSPGGSVVPGLFVVSAIRVAIERGVEVRCVVPAMAASMAMIILDNCSSRYVLANSLMLWHSIKATLQGNFDPDTLEQAALSMRVLSDGINEHMRENLKMDKKLFYGLFSAEAFVPGHVLKRLAPHYVTVVTDIRGVKDLYRVMKQESFFDRIRKPATKQPEGQSPESTNFPLGPTWVPENFSTDEKGGCK